MFSLMGFYGLNCHVGSREMLLFEEKEMSAESVYPFVRVLCMVG